MDMVEDGEREARYTIFQCKQMYQETRNPHFIVEALSASHAGEVKPPEWALEPLLDAVNKAIRKHYTTGERVSIDAALGLALSRGKKRLEHIAFQQSIEARVFKLVKIIHACFVVSIPNACRLAYYAIDCDFARKWETNSWKSFDPKPKSAITGEQSLETDFISRAQLQQRINTLEDPEAVKYKLRTGKIWEITHGDRLGYGLEQLIDKYYRTASKRRAPLQKLNTEPPHVVWDDAVFATRLSKWRADIVSGKSTAEKVIAKASSARALTQAQKAQIRGEKTKPDENDVTPNEFRLFAEGFLMLQLSEECTHKISFSSVAVGYPLRSISAVATLKRRAKFARFVDFSYLRSTVRK